MHLSHVITELLDPESTLYTRIGQTINGSKIIIVKLERKDSLNKYKVNMKIILKRN